MTFTWFGKPKHDPAMVSALLVLLLFFFLFFLYCCCFFLYCSCCCSCGRCPRRRSFCIDLAGTFEVKVVLRWNGCAMTVSWKINPSSVFDHLPFFPHVKVSLYKIVPFLCPLLYTVYIYIIYIHIMLYGSIWYMLVSSLHANCIMTGHWRSSDVRRYFCEVETERQQLLQWLREEGIEKLLFSWQFRFKFRVPLQQYDEYTMDLVPLLKPLQLMKGFDMVWAFQRLEQA